MCFFSINGKDLIIVTMNFFLPIKCFKKIFCIGLMPIPVVVVKSALLKARVEILVSTQVIHLQVDKDPHMHQL